MSLKALFSVDMHDVTLHCENSMMKHVIDRFGEDIETGILDTEHFATYVRVPASPTFFAWVFTFGGSIQITAPEDIIENYQKMLKPALR